MTEIDNFINKIKVELLDINNTVNNIKAEKDNKNLYSKLNYLSENLALDTRKLSIIENINSQKLFDFDDKNDNCFDIKIERLGTEIIKITLPELLNSRYVAKSKEGKKYALPPKYFIAKLKYAIINFIEKNNYKISQEKQDLFVFNMVNKDLPDTKIPDTDNREYKELFNLIKQYFIPDDSYQYVSYHLDTIKASAENQTILYLFNHKNFEQNYKRLILDIQNY